MSSIITQPIINQSLSDTEEITSTHNKVSARLQGSEIAEEEKRLSSFTELYQPLNSVLKITNSPNLMRSDLKIVANINKQAIKSIADFSFGATPTIGSITVKIRARFGGEGGINWTRFGEYGIRHSFTAPKSIPILFGLQSLQPRQRKKPSMTQNKKMKLPEKKLGFMEGGKSRTQTITATATTIISKIQDRSEMSFDDLLVEMLGNTNEGDDLWGATATLGLNLSHLTADGRISWDVDDDSNQLVLKTVPLEVCQTQDHPGRHPMVLHLSYDQLSGLLDKANQIRTQRITQTQCTQNDNSSCV